jgi:26S proteasome regulatory subunit N1
MTLSPIYGDSLLLHPVALASLLVVAYAPIMAEELIIKSDPLLLFFVAPTISPRLLITLDEELNIIPAQVRVGAAINVVGQTGRPRTIAGFRQMETPAVIAVGSGLSELMSRMNRYRPFSKILLSSGSAPTRLLHKQFPFFFCFSCLEDLSITIRTE